MGSIWGAKVREKQSGIPIWIKTRFCGDFGFVLKVILGPTINDKSIEKATSMDFWGIIGETLFWDNMIRGGENLPPVAL